MLTSQNFNFNTTTCILDYIPARLVEGKEWFVCFYAKYPPTGKLKRKKIKLNRIRSKTQRRILARKLISDINTRLVAGWNPFIEEAAPKAYHKFFDVIETYLSVHEKDLENRTLSTYRSYIRLLKKILEKKGFDEGMFVYRFDKFLAADVMLEIKKNPDLSLRTYNNYLFFFKSLFNWMKSYNYVSSNPFDGIARVSKKKTKAHRRLWTPEEREILKNFLQKENPRFLAMCMLCYYCFLRPKEIVLLKAEDFHLAEQTITVRADIAKNDNRSLRTVPNEMMPYLIGIDWEKIAPDDYVFSGDGTFGFGRKEARANDVAKYFKKISKELGFPDDLFFYNLKHTGITDMLAAGVAPNFVQGQADHHSLEMTSIYAATSTRQGNEQIKKVHLPF